MALGIGETVHRLTVIGDGGKDQRRKRLVRCRCMCGNEVTIRQDNLTGKRLTKSCGCLIAEERKDRELRSRRAKAGHAKKAAANPKPLRIARKTGNVNWAKGHKRAAWDNDDHREITHGARPAPGGTIRDQGVQEFMAKHGVTRIEVR